MGPGSFQWCLATGWGAKSTDWSIRSSIWTRERTSLLWGCQSTGTGCLGRLWSLLLWRYSRPAWTRSCAACCRWPCFGRGVRLDDPQSFLPTPTILWFCDSAMDSSQSTDYTLQSIPNWKTDFRCLCLGWTPRDILWTQGWATPHDVCCQSPCTTHVGILGCCTKKGGVPSW